MPSLLAGGAKSNSASAVEWLLKKQKGLNVCKDVAGETRGGGYHDTPLVVVCPRVEDCLIRRHGCRFGD